MLKISVDLQARKSCPSLPLLLLEEQPWQQGEPRTSGIHRHQHFQKPSWTRFLFNWLKKPLFSHTGSCRAICAGNWQSGARGCGGIRPAGSWGENSRGCAQLGQPGGSEEGSKGNSRCAGKGTEETPGDGGVLGLFGVIVVRR